MKSQYDFKPRNFELNSFNISTYTAFSTIAKNRFAEFIVCIEVIECVPDERNSNSWEKQF